MPVSLPTQTLKMALTIVVTGPIVLAYPLVQRYFVQGITIGAVKGCAVYKKVKPNNIK